MGDEEPRWGTGDVEKQLNISSTDDSGGSGGSDSGGGGGAAHSESTDPPSSSSSYGWLEPYNGTDGPNPFGLSDYEMTRIKVAATIAVGIAALWCIYAGRRRLSRLWAWWKGEAAPNPNPDPDPALDPEPQVEEPEDEADNEQLALPGAGRGQLALPQIPMGGGPFIPMGGGPFIPGRGGGRGGRGRGGRGGRGRGRGGRELHALALGRGWEAPPLLEPGRVVGNGTWAADPNGRLRKT